MQIKQRAEAHECCDSGRRVGRLNRLRMEKVQLHAGLFPKICQDFFCENSWRFPTSIGQGHAKTSQYSGRAGLMGYFGGLALKYIRQ